MKFKATIEIEVKKISGGSVLQEEVREAIRDAIDETEIDGYLEGIGENGDVDMECTMFDVIVQDS